MAGKAPYTPSSSFSRFAAPHPAGLSDRLASHAERLYRHVQANAADTRPHRTRADPSQYHQPPPRPLQEETPKVSLIVAGKGVEVPACLKPWYTRPALTSSEPVCTGPPHLFRPSLSESQSANVRTLKTGAQSTPSPSAMAAVLCRCARRCFHVFALSLTSTTRYAPRASTASGRRESRLSTPSSICLTSPTSIPRGAVTRYARISSSPAFSFLQSAVDYMLMQLPPARRSPLWRSLVPWTGSTRA